MYKKKNKYSLYSRQIMSAWMKANFFKDMDEYGLSLIEDFGSNEPFCILEGNGVKFLTMFVVMGKNSSIKPGEDIINALKEIALDYDAKLVLVPINIEGVEESDDLKYLKANPFMKNPEYTYYGLFDLEGNEILI